MAVFIRIGSTPGEMSQHSALGRWRTKFFENRDATAAIDARLASYANRDPSMRDNGYSGGQKNWETTERLKAQRDRLVDEYRALTK